MKRVIIAVVFAAMASSAWAERVYTARLAPDAYEPEGDGVSRRITHVIGKEPELLSRNLSARQANAIRVGAPPLQ